jgi:hypothetical protein
MSLEGLIASQYSGLWAVLVWIVISCIFLLLVPFSLHALVWLSGMLLPGGMLREHALGQYIGLWGLYVGAVFMLGGIALAIYGWSRIRKSVSTGERSGSGQGNELYIK